MGKRSCVIMDDTCGLTTNVRYGGVLFLTLFDKPWRIIASLLLGLSVVAVRQWNGTPVNLQKLLLAAGIMWGLDTLSGMIRGMARKDFSSARVGCSVTKGLVYALSIIAAETIDEALGLGNAFMASLAGLILLREATSFIENSAQLGFPWPAALTDRLEVLKGEVEKVPVPTKEDGTDAQ